MIIYYIIYYIILPHLNLAAHIALRRGSNSFFCARGLNLT